jgi:ribonuclease HI
LKQSVEATEAFQTANAPQIVLANVDRETRPQNRWIAPSPGWVKINWNASIDKKKGCIGLGAIIRDSAGNVLAAHGIVREGLSDPTTTEALGVILAIPLGRNRGLRMIQVEGDAKLIVEAVNSGNEDSSMRGHLIADIRVFLRDFQVWKVEHVSREGNKAAHILARMAVNQNLDSVWNGTVPENIRDLVVSEQMDLLQ